VIVAKEIFSLFLKSAAKIVETKISSIKKLSVCYHVDLTKHLWPGNLFLRKNQGGFFQKSASDCLTAEPLCDSKKSSAASLH
jgi:hypothetical protein